MILGTDSSVTRLSYSLTSIQGMSALLLPQDESADDNERDRELHRRRDAAALVPAVQAVGGEELRPVMAGTGKDVLEVGGGREGGADDGRIREAAAGRERSEEREAEARLQLERLEVLGRDRVAGRMQDEPLSRGGRPRARPRPPRG